MKPFSWDLEAQGDRTGSHWGPGTGSWGTRSPCSLAVCTPVHVWPLHRVTVGCLQGLPALHGRTQSPCIVQCCKQAPTAPPTTAPMVALGLQLLPKEPHVSHGEGVFPRKDGAGSALRDLGEGCRERT